ncbi:hypothetical protein VDGL01_09329 [Verticillium dahliae]
MNSTGSEIKDEASTPSSDNHVLNDSRPASSAKSSHLQTALKSLLVVSASRAPINNSQLEGDDVLSPPPDHILSPTHDDQASGDVIVVSSSRNSSKESSPFRVISHQESETISDAEKDLQYYPQTFPDSQHKRQLATPNIPLGDEEEGSVPLDMPITLSNPHDSQHPDEAEKHSLIGLNHYHIKEFVKQRVSIKGESPRIKRQNDMLAVAEARRRLESNPAPETAAMPAMAHGLTIPEDTVICIHLEIAKRRKLGPNHQSGVCTINGGGPVIAT